MLAPLYLVSPVLPILFSCGIPKAAALFRRRETKFSLIPQWFMDNSFYGIVNVTFLAQYRASFEAIFD